MIISIPRVVCARQTSSQRVSSGETGSLLARILQLQSGYNFFLLLLLLRFFRCAAIVGTVGRHLISLFAGPCFPPRAECGVQYRTLLVNLVHQSEQPRAPLFFFFFFLAPSQCVSPLIFIPAPRVSKAWPRSFRFCIFFFRHFYCPALFKGKFRGSFVVLQFVIL